MRVITVARKPFKGSVASCAVEHGTGALNIDGCRVGESGGTTRSGQAGYPKNPDGTEDRSMCWARTGHSILETGSGRWPANLILEHLSGCQLLGTKKVAGITGGKEGPIRKTGVHAEAGGHQTIGRKQPPVKGYADAEGLETIEKWDCQEGCPVRALDQQSRGRGMHSAGSFCVADRKPKGIKRTVFSDFQFDGGIGNRYGDTGGASRFFKQVRQIPVVQRANGKVICEGCGRFYREHPDDVEFPYLTRLCDGSRVKL